MLAEFDEGYFWTLGLRKTRRRKRIRLLTENKSGETESRRLSLLLAGRRTAQGLSLTFFQLLAGTSFFEVSSSRNVPSLNGKESIIIWLPYWNDALNIKCIVLPPILNVNSSSLNLQSTPPSYLRAITAAASFASPVSEKEIFAVYLWATIGALSLTKFDGFRVEASIMCPLLSRMI